MSPRNTFAATRRSHAILQKLRQGKGVKIREVSDEYGIEYPQARADLKLLEELYDLETYRDGRIKVWEMPGAGDPKRHVGIAAALELGGIALDIFKNTPYGERIDEVIDEARRKVRFRAREQVDRLSKALVLRRTWLPTDDEGMFETLEVLLDSIGRARGVEITYERSDGEVGDYLVVPRRLIWYQDRLWLQGVDAGEQKLFDVAGVVDIEQYPRTEVIERIVDRRLADDDYELPGDVEVEVADAEEEEEDENDAEAKRRQAVADVVEQDVGDWFEYGSRDEEDAYFDDAFGIFATNYEPETVELLVHGSWKQYLERYRIHPSQENVETNDGLRVRLDVGLCPEFKSFLMGMIPDVEVKAPAKLREELNQRVDAWR